MMYVVLDSANASKDRLSINGISLEENREKLNRKGLSRVTAGGVVKVTDDFENHDTYDAIWEMASIQFRTKALFINAKGIYYKTKEGKVYLNGAEIQGLNYFLNGVRYSGLWDDELLAPKRGSSLAPESDSAPVPHLAPEPDLSSEPDSEGDEIVPQKETDEEE